MRVQICTFFIALRYFHQGDVVFYVNTILPIGPALAGKMMMKRVVYHYHENAHIKGMIYRFLCKVMEWLASDIICVSEYQKSFLHRKKNVYVVPNAVDEDFEKRTKPNISQAFQKKKVLMLGSLKVYKGTLEYIQLASHLREFKFDLIVNDTMDNITVFLESHKIEIPCNLTIYSRQSDVIPFYSNASLVLNLSNKNMFVETFGLTALEAMTSGLPVIVPTVGGVAELVENGVNGFKIDVQDLSVIQDTIQQILTDKKLYESLANNALAFSKKFNEEVMCDAIAKILNS